MRRRPDGHQVEHRMFAVGIPAGLDETILRPPSHREQSRMIIEHPWVIDPLVNFPPVFYDLGVIAEALAYCQNARKQESGVDRRKLALPLALACPPIDEVVEPSPLVRHLLREEAQAIARPLTCLTRLHPATLGGYAKRCQSESSCGYAGDMTLALVVLGPVGARAIKRQAGLRVRLLPEKAE